MTVTDELAAWKNITPKGDDHSAWLDGLSPDARAVVHTPPGYLHTFIYVALTKRALQTEGITVAYRLKFLEHLNSMTDNYFVPDMLEAIQPMSDAEYQMFVEVKSLDAPDSKSLNESFKVLTSLPVFGLFIALNPSLLAACTMQPRMRRQMEMN